MRLVVGQYATQIRCPGLTFEQQGRLAMAWPTIWLANDLSLESWRKALGYNSLEWSDVLECYRDVLDDGVNPGWALPFMRYEWSRQVEVSEKQRTNRNGGAPRCTVVDHGEPRLTTVHPALAVASASEPESQSLSSTDGGLERVESSPRRPKKVLSPRDAEWIESFPNFWAEYPRRQKRPDAEKAWAACPLREQAGFDQIISGLDRWRKSGQWTRDSGKFIPLPATWLRAAQYDDEIPEELC
jgi:hypothetical protein